jgi:DNA-binding transcriptional LysR family regulator
MSRCLCHLRSAYVLVPPPPIVSGLKTKNWSYTMTRQGRDKDSNGWDGTEMNITLMQLKAFLTVARFSSFTSAAQVLHVSQPALTVQVQQLEQSLNLRLFDRDTRHVVLTPSGRHFAPMFQRLLLELETIVDDAQNVSELKQGIVRLGCIPSVATTYLPETISSFRERYPHVSFDLRDANGQGILEMVRSDKVEIGITNANPKWADLDAIDLYEEEIHVVFPKSHVISSFKTVTLDDIAEYPLVFLDTGFNSRTVLDAALASVGRLVKPVCEVGFTSTAIGMVRAGLGLAMLGSLVVSASNLRSFPDLQSRRIDSPDLVLEIKLVRKAGRSLSPSAQAFVDMILKTNRRNRWALARG